MTAAITAGTTASLPQSTPAAPATPGSKGRMQSLLTDWATRGWLRQLDTAFADFLWREMPDAPPKVPWMINARTNTGRLGLKPASRKPANSPACARSNDKRQPLRSAQRPQIGAASAVQSVGSTNSTPMAQPGVSGARSARMRGKYNGIPSAVKADR